MYTMKLYGPEHYKKLSEDGKQKLVKYRRKNYRLRRNGVYNYKKYFV